MPNIVVFQKIYEDEFLSDLSRDLHESFDVRFNPIIKTLPEPDKFGFHSGSWKITLEYIDGE